MNTIDRLDPVAWMPRARSPACPAFSWRDALMRLWRHLTEPGPGPLHDELVELDAHTLCDIGASDRLMARAQARREALRHERDALHLGGASGGWRHW